MFAQFVLSAACVTCHCRPHLAAGRGDRQWMCPRNSINYCEVVPNHRHYMNARHYMDAKNQPLSRHSINTKRILSSRRHCMNHLDMNAKNHHLSSRRRTKKSCYIVIKSMVFDVTRFIADHPGGESGALPVLVFLCPLPVFDGSQPSSRLQISITPTHYRSQ